MANPENSERDGMDVWGNGLMWNQEEEDMGQETFRHFTRDELEKIEQRIFDKKLLDKKKKERREKNIQVCG